MMNFGRSLISLGLLIVLIGILTMFLNKIPGFGRLPGDILIQKKNSTFYFPVTTMIILSIVLSVLLNFLGRK